MPITEEARAKGAAGSNSGCKDPKQIDPRETWDVSRSKKLKDEMEQLGCSTKSEFLGRNGRPGENYKAAVVEGSHAERDDNAGGSTATTLPTAVQDEKATVCQRERESQPKEVLEVMPGGETNNSPVSEPVFLRVDMPETHIEAASGQEVRKEGEQAASPRQLHDSTKVSPKLSTPIVVSLPADFASSPHQQVLPSAGNPVGPLPETVLDLQMERPDTLPLQKSPLFAEATPSRETLSHTPTIDTDLVEDMSADPPNSRLSEMASCKAAEHKQCEFYFTCLKVMTGCLLSQIFLAQRLLCSCLSGFGAPTKFKWVIYCSVVTCFVSFKLFVEMWRKSIIFLWYLCSQFGAWGPWVSLHIGALSTV
jgi:hypothetical protein